jgi:hypothetical protein
MGSPLLTDVNSSTDRLDEAPAEGTRYTREQVEAMIAATGYDLDQHPAHIVRKVHQRATTCFQKVMAGEDLTPTQFAALATILHHGELSQNHLGRRSAWSCASCESWVSSSAAPPAPTSGW